MNLQQIADKLDFDLEDVQMLMDMFISDTLKSLSEVEQHIALNNKTELRNIAHGIKGSASNLMLEEVTQIALEIENLAKDVIEADYKSLFEDLKQNIKTLEREKEEA